MSETSGNHYRGDVVVQVGDKEYTLCFRWQQFAKLETLFGVKGWMAASGKCDLFVTDRTAQQEVALLRLLLETHHPEFAAGQKLSDDDVGDLLSEMTRDAFLEHMNVALAQFSGGAKAGDAVRRKVRLIHEGNAAELAKMEAEAEAERSKGPKARKAIST